MNASIGTFSDLDGVLQANPFGCFVDTTILFAATYPLDRFNEEGESAFGLLSDRQIPIFTNVNVRAEFLEQHRRVLIAESLIDFLEAAEPDLNGPLLERLKAHRTSYRRRVQEDKSIKMDVNQIKMFRNLFASYKIGKLSGWDEFCRHYLHRKLILLWKETEQELELQFISSRSSDQNPMLHNSPDWELAVDLMGRYGIGSSDAMILNMFLCSKTTILLTADAEMAECALNESKGAKQIFVPDSALSIRS